MYSYPLVPSERFKDTGKGFLSDEYFAERGKWHRGMDLNIVTGGDTDLGYPVVNMLPGTVVFAEVLPTNWGGLVMVRTDDYIRQQFEDLMKIDLAVLDILYAHLLHVTVKTGQFLNSGTAIGSVGNGNGSFLAHLHLETRNKDFLAYKSQDTDKQFVLDNCFDPFKLFETGLFGDASTEVPFGKFELKGNVYLNDLLAGKNAAINRVSGKKLFIRVG